ncbi:MAG TPA: hypothetical protein VK501_13885 [Baekduia sp.]|uniref:hypothetical protein n=1 Tax=Baekduia sp. TaxID=2600305 RepID=UPI002BA3120B|nr:hypothetical protein [Baekduia sp.]HMJ34998.1 hypothetical protein [Baekduia sp.]
MRNKPRSILVALIVIGALAAGGAAFTASNTIPDTTMGFGTSNITGATATSLTYTRSADGSTITAATLVFTGDISANTVEAGFNSNALEACAAGTYSSPSTTVVCTFTTPEPTAGATTFNVAVS